MNYRKLLVAIMLSLVSTGTMAAWTAVGKSESSEDFTVYVNKSSIHKKGNLVKMWSMFNFKSPRETNEYRYSSYKQLVEYDCNEGQSRMIGYSLHSKNMGMGGAVYKNSKTGNWVAVEPNSVAESLWKIACSKEVTN
jgi:predicted ribosomally synthesized peptide with SipW-like signal peptide